MQAILVAAFTTFLGGMGYVCYKHPLIAEDILKWLWGTLASLIIICLVFTIGVKNTYTNSLEALKALDSTYKASDSTLVLSDYKSKSKDAILASWDNYTKQLDNVWLYMGGAGFLFLIFWLIALIFKKEQSKQANNKPNRTSL